METRATFRLTGPGSLTAARVTERLGVPPSRMQEAGALVSRRSTARRETSVWLLNSSPDIETDTGLAEQLGRLLDRLEPISAAIWELVHEGYEADWYCWIASHATEHAAILDRALLRRFLALPGDLWLDVCGDDMDGDS
ncbi:MAG: DUF4279 domain-containing protein [Streptosporangiaceae bacterium]